MEAEISVREVVYELLNEMLESRERLDDLLGDDLLSDE
jgi:hypothetical protein